MSEKQIGAIRLAILDKADELSLGGLNMAVADAIARAALQAVEPVKGWQDIETAPDDTHIRGLWVRVKRAGIPDFWYWDCYAGFIDDETGEWKTLSDDDCGWSAGDFTNWIPFPAAPTNQEQSS